MLKVYRARLSIHPKTRKGLCPLRRTNETSRSFSSGVPPTECVASLGLKTLFSGCLKFQRIKTEAKKPEKETPGASPSGLGAEDFPGTQSPGGCLYQEHSALSSKPVIFCLLWFFRSLSFDHWRFLFMRSGNVCAHRHRSQIVSFAVALSGQLRR